MKQEKTITELKEKVSKMIGERSKIKIDEKIGFKSITIIPNEQELHFAKKLRMSNIYSSPVAVRNRKVSTKELIDFMNVGQAEKEGFEAIIQESAAYKFMYHPQFKMGTSLNTSHLNTIDEAQDTNLTPYFLIYQSSANVSILDFINRLVSVSKKFSNKKLIPVLDPSTKDLIELRMKALVIAKLGYKSVAISYRNPKDYLDGWQVIQSVLLEAKIETVCLGIYFRWCIDKNINPKKEERISNLCSPLIFGCAGVAHYRPWSGGKVDDTLLEENMFYEVTSQASPGKIKYNGKNRLTTYTNIIKSKKYNFCRVDAVLQAQEILSRLQPITPINLVMVSSRINGIGYFANKFGML